MDPGAVLGMLVCPACRQALDAFPRCLACGAEYGLEDGIVSVLPEVTARTVSFQHYSAAPAGRPAFQECFCYPPTSETRESDRPYHLDSAHAVVLHDLKPESLVLEIGCGGGQMRTYVESMGHRYLGTDISRTRVHEHLQRYGGPDVICDAHFLPFADNAFDLVYSAAVTEHLRCPYLVVQEVARVLRPGGHYLGNVSFMEPWHDDSMFHMSPLGVYELLCQADLEIRHIWPGRGYSGFRALTRMGNTATRALAFAGDLLGTAYNVGCWLRDRVRRTGRRARIHDAARIAGAIDWIARKRPHAASTLP